MANKYVISVNTENVYITVEIPGKKKEDFKITLEGGNICIKNKEYNLKIPNVDMKEIDVSNMSSIYIDGVLKIVLPKLAGSIIEVKVE